MGSTTNNGTEENTGVEQFSPFGGLISSTKNGGLATSPKTQLPSDRTPTFEESLSNSLLVKLDKDKATQAEMEEAFCRDVDSFSFDLNQYDGRPDGCKELVSYACLQLHYSKNCKRKSKFTASIHSHEYPFSYPTWETSYRGEAEHVGVRAGCTFTVYSASGYTGNQRDITAGEHDVWMAFGNKSDLYTVDKNTIGSFN